MKSRKRKIAVLATVFSLALFALTYGFVFPSGALAWNNCPKGLTNDPYPGVCRRYVDTNNDGICDLSQSEPVAASTVVTNPPETTSTTQTKQAETTTTTSLAVATTTSGTPPTGDCPLGPCANCGACLSTGVSSAAVATIDNSSDASSEALIATGGSAAVVASSGSATTSTTTPTSDGSGTGSATATSLAATESAAAAVTVPLATTSGSGASFLTHYLVSPIALGFILVYGVSFWLYRSKRIKIATHRKIWNLLLLGTFLITGIFGTILAIQLDYAPTYIWPVNLLFWHVEAGVVMTFISLFHMAWHFKYYKGIVRNAREKWRVLRETQRESDVADGQLVLETREARRAERDARRSGGKAAGAHDAAPAREQARCEVPAARLAQPVWQQRPAARPGGRSPFDLEQEGA